MATLTPQRGRSRGAANTPSTNGHGQIQVEPLIADWPQWQQTLATRRRPKSWASVIGDSAALSWGRANFVETFDSLAAELAVEKLAAWNAAPPQEHATEEAVSGLQAAVSLAVLAQHAAAEVWQAALRKLLATCQDARALEPGVAQALAAAELPLVLVQAFPELPVCAELAGPAIQELDRSLAAVLDPRGTPAAVWWNELPALVASWTRVRKLTAALGLAWPTDAEARWRALLPQLVRLIKPNHQQTVTGFIWSRELLEALITSTPSARSQRIARENWNLDPAEASGRPLSAISAAHAAEDLRCAVLWSDWSPRAPRLAVAYSDRACRLDVSVGGVTLLRGAANPLIKIDQQPLAIDSDWEQICWQSDADVDYLELEVDLTSGWRLQRHLFLAREDRLLLVADALLGEQAALLEYELPLPLADAEFEPAKETTEGWLTAKRRQFSVVPLALPEWQSASRGGRLTAQPGTLRHTLSAHGRTLFAPLLVDLDTTRSRQPLTWRQLTVAETRVIQKPDVAVGYRAQLGRQQWIVYRSLGERANRTLLGHNTAYEFVVARFLRTGHVDTLLQIE
jgi:hypothetical protein